MSGKMPAEYFRAYRVRRREAGNPIRPRPGYVRHRGDRSAEYAKRNAARLGTGAAGELPLLMPELQVGRRIAFWEDELRLDLAQEARLAELEGRDPAAAIAAYRAREINWLAHIAPLYEGSVAA